MKAYVSHLGLHFDPFEPSAVTKAYFEGGSRQQIREKIIERAIYSESVISVFGCLGSGKSTLLAAVAKSFGDEAAVVNVLATLFMNSDQFMDDLISQLQLSGNFSSQEDRIKAVVQFASELDLEAKSLVIQIDDAQELSAEVIADLLTLKQSSPAGSVHLILFGESQLGNTLESSLPDDELANLAEFELEGLGSEDTFDYVRFKLEAAGHTKPLPLTGNSLGEIHNASNGIPGAINAMVADALEEQVGADADRIVPAEPGSVDLTQTQESDEEAESEEARSSAKGYFLAAGILLAVFVGAIVFLQPQDQNDVAVTQISVPVNSGAVQQEAEASLTSIADRSRVSESLVNGSADGVAAEELPESETDAGNSSENFLADGSVTEESKPDLTPTPLDPEADKEPVLVVAIEPDEPQPTETAQITTEEVKVNAPVESPGVEAATEAINESGLSGFERSIMAYAASNYTVQIVGSSSESNIQDFLSRNELGGDSGYFETRLNDKPWFVVIAGSFPDRESAVAFLENLPQSVKSSGPWVRPFVGIQSDIQSLQAAN